VTDDPEKFVASARPGARAPHVALKDGSSTLDLYGRGFVLARFGEEAPEDRKLVEAATARGVPIRVEAVDHAEAAAIYETRLVLVRPDGHVAWRGNNAPSDPMAVIDRVRGA
jgi:hypothetical protein